MTKVDPCTHGTSRACRVFFINSRNLSAVLALSAPPALPCAPHAAPADRRDIRVVPPDARHEIPCPPDARHEIPCVPHALPPIPVHVACESRTHRGLGRSSHRDRNKRLHSRSPIGRRPTECQQALPGLPS